MQLPRFLGLVDLAIATVVIGIVVIPARQMYAASAAKGDDAAQFALGVAEARTIAHPEDGAALADFTRRLGEAAFKDWAVEAAVHGAARARSSSTRSTSSRPSTTRTRPSRPVTSRRTPARAGRRSACSSTSSTSMRA